MGRASLPAGLRLAPGKRHRSDGTGGQPRWRRRPEHWRHRGRPPRRGRPRPGGDGTARRRHTAHHDPLHGGLGRHLDLGPGGRRHRRHRRLGGLGEALPGQGRRPHGRPQPADHPLLRLRQPGHRRVLPGLHQRVDHRGPVRPGRPGIHRAGQRPHRSPGRPGGIGRCRRRRPPGDPGGTGHGARRHGAGHGRATGEHRHHAHARARGVEPLVADPHAAGARSGAGPRGLPEPDPLPGRRPPGVRRGRGRHPPDR